MGKVRVGLCAAVAALVLAGCTAGVGGTAVPAGEEPLTSASLGEMTSVEPCSLTGPAAFSEVGTAQMPGMPTFDECRVTVTVDGGHAYVWVGLLRDETAMPDTLDRLDEPGRGTAISSLDGTCDAALVLADGVALTAWAEPAYGSRLDGDMLCALTESALRGAYQVLDSGRVRHRVPEVSSLGVLDACDVVRTRDAATVLGLDSVAESPYPGGHRCRYGDPDGDAPRVDVEFHVAVAADAVGVPAGTVTETIAGRETWLVGHRDGDRVVCTAVTEHVAFAGGTGTLEFAVLRVVAIPRRGRDVCGSARTLAGLGWPELPRLA